MRTWSLYHKATGALAGRTVTCSDAELVANTPAGFGLVEGAHDHLCRRVNLVTGQVEPFVPERPEDDDQSTWDWDAQVERWLPVPTLLALQDARWSAIKAQREAATVAPVMETPHGVFDADQNSIEKVTKAVLGRREAERLLGTALPSITWTLADDSGVHLTTDQLAHVAVLLLMRGDAAHQVARALREQIYAASTAEAVEAISWPEA